MRIGWIILTGSALVVVLAMLVWLASGDVGQSRSVTSATQPSATTKPSAVRLALVPERDVFVLRRSYQPLIRHLSASLGRPVELVTLNTYEAVLQDFEDRQIDGAFLGSLVAVLAMDRRGAQVLVRPQRPDGVSMYRGIIFVRDDSPIRSLDELRFKRFAMLKTTYAGSLFPLSEMAKRGWLRDTLPRILWAGTHEDVIAEVLAGRADVGAVKDLILDAYEKAHPEVKLRRLATSKPVPNNALVLRRTVNREIGPKLRDLLLHMNEDAEGREALAALGAQRFIPCQSSEYEAIFEMLDVLGPDWNTVGVPGNAPSRAVLEAKP